MLKKNIESFNTAINFEATGTGRPPPSRFRERRLHYAAKDDVRRHRAAPLAVPDGATGAALGHQRRDRPRRRQGRQVAPADRAGKAPRLGQGQGAPAPAEA